MRKYTFEQHLKESLKDPEFRKIWEESELEYQLGRQLIEARLKKNISQRDLAKKAHTTQAVISRIEGMNSNPSIGLLKKIARALGAKIQISFS
ncbi:helix-turn-helix transcriptional regulator [Candidatus Daviesbacteria bacterium]|nr:helix-turn-helix transcriptional regulator [Candidatus Daviesbacteria bacterium]